MLTKSGRLSKGSSLLTNGRYGMWKYCVHRDNDFSSVCSLYDGVITKYIDLETLRTYISAEVTYDALLFSEEEEEANAAVLEQAECVFYGQPEVVAAIQERERSDPRYTEEGEPLFYEFIPLMRVLELEDDGRDRVRMLSYYRCEEHDVMRLSFFLVYEYTGNGSDGAQHESTVHAKDDGALDRLLRMRECEVDVDCEKYNEYSLDDIMFDVTQKVCKYTASIELDGLIECNVPCVNYMRVVRDYGEHINLNIPLCICSSRDLLKVDVQIGLSEYRDNIMSDFERCAFAFGMMYNDIDVLLFDVDDPLEVSCACYGLTCIRGLEFMVDRMRKVYLLRGAAKNDVIESYLGGDGCDKVIGCYFLLRAIDRSRIGMFLYSTVIPQLLQKYINDKEMPTHTKMFNTVYDLVMMVHDNIHSIRYNI